MDLLFSAKDTVAKEYDTRFKDIFENLYEENITKFENLGIKFSYTLMMMLFLKL